MAQWFLSLVIFSIVFGIAMSNPKVRTNRTLLRKGISWLDLGFQNYSGASGKSLPKHRDGHLSGNHDLQSVVTRVPVS
jgi:hypothetical protein